MKYLILSKNEKLGENSLEKIKITGTKKIPHFNLQGGDTFASRGQKLIYHHLPWGLEKLLLQTFIVPWSYLASRLYHDFYWYNLFGRKRIKEYLKTQWGKLFLQYGQKN